VRERERQREWKREKNEYACVRECANKREEENEGERCSGSSVFKKSQKSNKLTILLLSVDALIKGK